MDGYAGEGTEGLVFRVQEVDGEDGVTDERKILIFQEGEGYVKVEGDMGDGVEYGAKFEIRGPMSSHRSGKRRVLKRYSSRRWRLS